jgi:hypothetical protein
MYQVKCKRDTGSERFLLASFSPSHIRLFDPGNSGEIIPYQSLGEDHFLQHRPSGGRGGRKKGECDAQDLPDISFNADP